MVAGLLAAKETHVNPGLDSQTKMFLPQYKRVKASSYDSPFNIIEYYFILIADSILIEG